MSVAAFFADAPVIRLADPLAGFLGASADGVLEYSYLDAVKLAGHSCPTVAGAYLATVRALQHLYPQQLPQRGGIAVSFSAAQDEGVTGVMAAVVGLLTGAAAEGGFKGIAGRFVRRDLLRFGVAQPQVLRFVRLDNGAGVDVAINLQRVPAAPELRELLAEALEEDATPAQRRVFAELWQLRVRQILIERAEDPLLIELLPVLDAGS